MHYKSEHIALLKAGFYLAILLLAIYLLFFYDKALRHAPGVIIPYAPLQKTVISEPESLAGGFELTKVATFSIDAKVLGIERYKSGRMAEFSPMDFALGWDWMSDQDVIDQLDISQGGRFYRWFTKSRSIDPHQVALNSSNIHMLPANDSVANLLSDVRTGQIVHLSGHLVNIEDNNSKQFWRTSMSRLDTGAGACEIFLVDVVNIINVL